LATRLLGNAPIHHKRRTRQWITSLNANGSYYGYSKERRSNEDPQAKEKLNQEGDQRIPQMVSML